MVYKMADLFAGIGGIRLGFDLAFQDQAETVFVSEIDQYARQTYEANFDTPQVIHGDIGAVENDEVPDFDFLLAGFPCQAFSVIGKRQGFNDSYRGHNRGILFREIVRLCQVISPKIVFLENVPGLSHHNAGQTFETILSAFRDLEYSIFWKVLDAQDFGLAQRRKRIYIICFRSDLNISEFDWPEPTGQRVVLGDVLDPAPIPPEYYISQKRLNTLKIYNSRDHNFKRDTVLPNEIAPTMTKCGLSRCNYVIIDSRPHSRERNPRAHSEQNNEDVRQITVREAARLQGYPETFLFPCSRNQSYMQLGNSVAVPVVKAIAQKIKETLERGQRET